MASMAERLKKRAKLRTPNSRRRAFVLKAVEISYEEEMVSNTTTPVRVKEDSDSSLSFFSPVCSSSIRMAEELSLAEEVYEMEATDEHCEELPISAAYSEQAFLQMALGDELATTALSEPLPITETSDDSDPPYMTVKKYRTMTQQARLKRRPPLPAIPVKIVEDEVAVSAAPTLSADEKKNQYLELLLNEIYTQKVQMSQCSKALVICKSTHEFNASEEQVEAERGLLLANHRYQAVLSEMDHLHFKNFKDEIIESGSVSVSNITLSLRPSHLTDEMALWFVCLATQGKCVLATKPLQLMRESKIIFTDELKFVELQRNFVISLDVCSLRLRKVSLPYEEKYHLEQISNERSCPGMLGLRRNQTSQRSYSSFNQFKTSTLRSSSFNLVGSLRLDIKDLHQQHRPRRLSKVALSSPVTGDVSLTLRSCVKLYMQHSGFLTMMHQPGMWIRQWCCLSDHVVRYWDYPQDQLDKDALGQLNLRHVVSETVGPADRTICARPRTLLLQTQERRHLWHADSAQEFSDWCKKLSAVVSAIKMWNVS